MDDLLQKLPNWLTLLRLFLIPVFVLLLHWSIVSYALLVFIIAALTDYIDGYLARKFGAVSDFGKLLDPLADKVLVMAALVMLVAQRSELYGEPWVPGWMVVLVLAREIWVTGLRGIAASRGLIISASDLGKLKSFLQMLGIVLLLLHTTPLPLLDSKITCQLAGLNLILLSIVISYWSAVEYTYRVLMEEKKGGGA